MTDIDALLDPIHVVISDRDKEILSLKKDIAALEYQSDSLQEDLNDAQKDYEELQETLDNLKNDVIYLLSELGYDTRNINLSNLSDYHNIKQLRK